MVVILLKRLGFGTLIGAFIALIGVIVVLSVRMVRSLDSYMKRGPRRSSIRMPPAGPPTLCRSNVPCKRIGPRLAIAASRSRCLTWPPRVSNLRPLACEAQDCGGAGWGGFACKLAA